MGREKPSLLTRYMSGGERRREEREEERRDFCWKLRLERVSGANIILLNNCLWMD